MTNPKKILLADDHTLIRSGLADVIKTIASDVELFQAQDGKEAIEILNNQKIDIAVLDVDLPHYTGLEIAQLIRRDMLAKYIVIITGDVSMQTAYIAMEIIGVDAYLLKGNDITQTITTIKTMLDDNATNIIKPPKIIELGIEISLSKRQKEILLLIADKKSSEQIAQKLSITVNTVRKHREHINKKLS